MQPGWEIVMSLPSSSKAKSVTIMQSSPPLRHMLISHRPEAEDVPFSVLTRMSQQLMLTMPAQRQVLAVDGPATSQG